MIIKNEKELKALEKIGKICAIVRDEMAKAIKIGITTKELDQIGEQVLKYFGAKSAPKYAYKFPGYTCISVNDEVAHGIPGDYIIKEGDLVNIDVSAQLNGYYADTGKTILIESEDPLKKGLCDCSYQALMNGIHAARANHMINRIGKAIHDEAKRNGFTVIKNLTGHGVGKKIHEAPHVLNYYDIMDFNILQEGQVLAIETFVSSKAEYVIEDRNGWSLRTPDKSYAVQYEHTIVVQDGSPLILTKL